MAHSFLFVSQSSHYAYLPVQRGHILRQTGQLLVRGECGGEKEARGLAVSQSTFYFPQVLGGCRCFDTRVAESEESG
jgi:hypothetical protein